MIKDLFGKEVHIGDVIAYGYRDHNHGFVDIIYVTDIRDGWIIGDAKPEDQWNRSRPGYRLRKFSLVNKCIVLPMTREQWDELGK